MVMASFLEILAQLVLEEQIVVLLVKVCIRMLHNISAFLVWMDLSSVMAHLNANHVHKDKEVSSVQLVM